MQGPYTHTEVLRKTGLQKDQINNLIAAGVIRPFLDRRGRGSSRRFSHRNVLDLLLCRELYVFGIRPATMREILRLIEATEAWQRAAEKKSGLFLALPTFRLAKSKSSARFPRLLFVEPPGEAVKMLNPELFPYCQVVELDSPAAKEKLLSQTTSLLLVDLTRLEEEAR